MLAGKIFFDRYHTQSGIYARHNREFTLSEVTALLEENGFEVILAKTLDRYNYQLSDMYVDSYDELTKLPWKGNELLDILEHLPGAVSENRGDNLYVVAQRPAN